MIVLISEVKFADAFSIKGGNLKVKSIYIGGWFQRTILQLSEIYDFLRDGTSQGGLDKGKLLSLRDNLRIDTIEYGVANEDFVGFTTEEHIRVKLFEDGLMIVSSDQVSEPTMFADIERVRGYYEERLSPALNYLFSMGAPVFKELASVESIYPYFIVCDNATSKDISDLLAKTERQKYFEFDGKNYNVLRGDKYYFINNKKATIENIERYIEEQVFIREFKGQLHRYLNLHRAIWGKIDAIKKQTRTSEDEALAAVTELDRYEKTALLIEGRLEQMAPYVSIREGGMKDDQELTEFLAISGYRYSALDGTLEYMKSLWNTTRRYAESAQRLLLRVEQERLISTCRAILTAVIILVIIGVLGLVFGSGLRFSIDSVIYGALLVVAGVLVAKLVQLNHSGKQYNILADNGKENQ